MKAYPSFVLFFVLSAASAAVFRYGRHFPNGQAAVDHIYSTETGTWKQMAPIAYVWNYYEHYATSTHPFDKGALITAANGSPGASYTTRDANGYLLCDHNHDLEIDADLAQNCGYAFHEHAGIGVDGSRRGNPFTNFWLDDNWLARYMSQAYGRPGPDGLSDQDSFMRWKPIGGDPSNWVLYNSMHFDTLALDGLYYIAVGDIGSAVRNWETSVDMSGATYEQQAREFRYPDIEENYHVGLFKILTERLLAEEGLEPALFSRLLQHSIGLRAHILSHQQRDSGGGFLLGWTSHVEGGSSLINTESVSCNVLALGAGAKYVVEAVGSTSAPGGSFPSARTLLPGNGTRYMAEFVLRSTRPVDGLGMVTVADVTTGQDNYLGLYNLKTTDFYGLDMWSSISVEFQVNAGGERLVQFDIYFGSTGSNLDSSIVRVHEL